MLRKLGVAHLKVLLIYLTVVTILRWEFPHSFGAFFDLVGLWVGGVIGLGLLGLDRVLYVYVIRPHEQLSQQIQEKVRTQHWKEALETLLARRKEQYHLAFRNGIFALVYIPVVFFAVASSSGLFGKGVVLGVMVHLLHDIWRDQLKNPSELNSWLFWMVSRDVTLEEQKIFVWVLTAAFGMVSLILL